MHLRPLRARATMRSRQLPRPPLPLPVWERKEARGKVRARQLPRSPFRSPCGSGRRLGEGEGRQSCSAAPALNSLQPISIASRRRMRCPKHSVANHCQVLSKAQVVDHALTPIFPSCVIFGHINNIVWKPNRRAATLIHQMRVIGLGSLRLL